MKKLTLISSSFFVFLFNFSFAQNVTLCLGQDRTVCPGTTVTINDCSSVGGGASAGSAAYTITTIPYNPDPFNSGTTVSLFDDSQTALINIGFNFCYFGQTYTQFIIGSNNWVGFSSGQTPTWVTTAIPNNAGTAPRNTIMGAWQDINPGAGGTVRYQVYGTAPNRRLVVSWYNVPMFSCTGQLYSSQIKIFESTNIIETHILNKQICSSWNSGRAVHGLHDVSGTIAVVVPGRNNTSWSTSNEGKRFSPGAVWANTLGQTFPYNAGQLIVNPVPPGTTGYFLKAGCGSGSGTAISDTTWITLATPSVTVAHTDDICTQSIGSVTATPGTGSPAPITYNWTPNVGNTASITNLPAGTYNLSITDGNGCTATASATVGDTPATFSGTTTQVSCPGGSDGTATATTSLNSGTEIFEWSTGQFTNSAPHTLTGLSAGNYWCYISSATCSDTVYFTVTEIPPLQISITSQINVNCYSLANGSASVNVIQGTAPYTYSWTTSSSTTNSATNLLAGSYTCTVTDVNGCTEDTTINITQPAPLTITSVTADTIICPGFNAPLTVSVTGGSSAYQYSWSTSNTNVGSTSNVTVTPTTSPTTYCVTVSEVCGSPSVDTCLTVSFPTPIVPSLTPDEATKCVPGNFTFVNSSSNSGEIQSTVYTFSNGDNYNISGSQGFSNTFQSSGTYDVIMTCTSIYGCVYDTTIQNIVTVIPLPVANFTVSKNPATWFETTIQTSDISTGNISQWYWSSPGATSITNGGPAGLIEFPQGVTGTYPITLTVTTPQGCSDSITLTIEIVPDIILYVPNSFTPDDDEHNQRWKYYINGVDMENFEIEIYNRWGEVIWESHDANETWDGTYGINGQKIPFGTYTWRISYKDKDTDGRKYHTGIINIIK